MGKKTTQQLVAEMDGKITELARTVGDTLQSVQSPFTLVPTPPANSNDTGTVGNICFHGDHMYYCYATNKWLKSIVSKEF